MPDVFTQAKRSEVMSRIRGRGNKETELALARLLRTHGISGWRLHLLIRATVESHGLRVERRKARRWNAQLSASNFQLTVRPDFVFPKLKLAVFVDGCFWHSCPQHATQPKNNRAFWKKKLTGNKIRGRMVSRKLRHHGWTVLRIWEHELARKNETRLLRRIQRGLI